MQNLQANEAGERADALIKRLANPSETIITDKAEVQVLDKATQVPHPGEQPVNAGEPANGHVSQDDYETRFKRYKASTDTTIHNLRKKVNQFDLLSTENDTLKKKLDNVQAQIPTTPNEMLEHFSQEEADVFNKLVDGKVGGLQGEVERLNAELETANKLKREEEVVHAHESVVAAVINAVPNYESIDKDPAFYSYMQDLDEFGNLRYNLLVKAKNSNPPDVGRIIQFYRDFANSNTAQEEQPKDNKSFTQQELLQNPTSQSSESPKTPQNRAIVWDQATILRLYTDKAKGKINPKQFQELEADMNASIRGVR